MKKKKETKSNIGLITLTICGLLTIILIIGCVFFPDKIFGLFTK